MRHADAGYQWAIEVARQRRRPHPMRAGARPASEQKLSPPAGESRRQWHCLGAVAVRSGICVDVDVENAEQAIEPILTRAGASNALPDRSSEGQRRNTTMG